MSRQDVILLVTCAGGDLMPAELLALAPSEWFRYRLVGVDAFPLFSFPARSLLDALHPVPRGGAPGFLEALCRIVEWERVDVVLPGSDEEAFTVARGREALRAHGAAAIVGSPECLARIQAKAATYRALEEADVRVPEHALADTAEKLAEAARRCGHPERTVVVKPRTGRGGRGVAFLCGADPPLRRSEAGPASGASSRERRSPTRSGSRCWMARCC
ncbi:MAG: hypothetical protein HY720_28435 [Planctomycetes bacterium]|nr:hypothetical protein [Planctomycetota bacterium]